jgi:hypothetical protein
LLSRKTCRQASSEEEVPERAKFRRSGYSQRMVVVVSDFKPNEGENKKPKIN